MSPTTMHVVVTYSPQPSVAYFLRGVLECAGVAVSQATFTLADLEAAVERDRPDAIVWDVGFPFRENWNQLEQVRRRPLARAIPIVITTAEARELFRAVGVSAALELFARPDDGSAVRAAVFHAIENAASDDARRSMRPDSCAILRLAMSQ